MAKSKDDLYSQAGAEALKKRIVAYWKARGFAAVVHRYQNPAFPGLWFVRSNLVNGYPPRR